MNKSFITIKMDDYFFGIDVAIVREVNRYVEITPVSLAPDYISGLMNLRGQIITIIDPGVRLNMAKRAVNTTSRCVVMKTSSELSNSSATLSLNETVGVLVDAVGDIVIVDEETIEPLPPNITELDGQYIDGIVKLEESLLMILRMDLLLKHDFKKS